MQLQNLLQHKKGTSISVNGHVYHIALDLIIRDAAGNAVDVPTIDADKLLKNPDAWRPLQATKAVPARATVKAGLKVILNDGTQVAPASELPALPVARPVEAPAVETKPQADPPIPKAGEDWADPQELYSLGWLQACAKAYKCNVPRNKSKDKAALVEKIKAAMYE
jgi:hypothetical protein